MWLTRRLAYVPVGCQSARESIKELTALPCSRQQLQCRLNESATRGTHARMQSCRQGALTCMGRVSVRSFVAWGVWSSRINQPNQRKKETHTHTHNAHGGQLEQWFLEHAARAGSGKRGGMRTLCISIADRKVGYEPAAGGMCTVTTRESNDQPFSAQRMKAGCSTAGHLRTQDVLHMIRSVLQARRTRTDRLDTTTEA